MEAAAERVSDFPNQSLEKRFKNTLFCLCCGKEIATKKSVVKIYSRRM